MFKKLANCSAEKASMLLHLMINRLGELGGAACTHSSTRKLYESGFEETIVKPIFDKMAQAEQKMADIIAGSEQGAQQMTLGKALDETDIPDPLEFPQLWRYREPLTLQRLQFEMMTHPLTEVAQPILRS